MTDRDNHLQAWNNWWNFWAQELGENYEGSQDRIGGYDAFEQFVGQNIFRDQAINPEAAHRVRLLLSPHHHAILKAYKAKHFPQEVS